MPPFSKPKASRQKFSNRLDKLSLKGASKYARFIREGDADKQVPCWGAIHERFEKTFKTDADRLQILEALIKEEDRRPLFLFLHSSRERPALIKVLCERADQLPLSVQRYLIAMPEAASLIEEHLGHFDASAQAIWLGGEAPQKKEREQLALRIGELMTFHYFVPDTFDPCKEADFIAKSNV